MYVKSNRVTEWYFHSLETNYPVPWVKFELKKHLRLSKVCNSILIDTLIIDSINFLASIRLYFCYIIMEKALLQEQRNYSYFSSKLLILEWCASSMQITLLF